MKQDSILYEAIINKLRKFDSQEISIYKLRIELSNFRINKKLFFKLIKELENKGIIKFNKLRTILILNNIREKKK